MDSVHSQMTNGPPYTADKRKLHQLQWHSKKRWLSWLPMDTVCAWRSRNVPHSERDVSLQWWREPGGVTGAPGYSGGCGPPCSQAPTPSGFLSHVPFLSCTKIILQVLHKEQMSTLIFMCVHMHVFVDYVVYSVRLAKIC